MRDNINIGFNIWTIMTTRKIFNQLNISFRRKASVANTPNSSNNHPDETRIFTIRGVKKLSDRPTTPSSTLIVTNNQGRSPFHESANHTSENKAAVINPWEASRAAMPAPVYVRGGDVDALVDELW